MKSNSSTNVIASLAALAVFALAWLFFDVPLRPEVRQFLTMPSAPVAEDKNLYYDLLGFTAPVGKDIHAAGLQWFRSIMDAAAVSARKGDTFTEPTEDPQQISFKGTIPKNSLVQLASDTSLGLDKLLADNAELLNRYQKLHAAAGITEPVDVTYAAQLPFPKVVPLRNCQSLFLAIQLRQSIAGNTTEALNAIDKDIRFWRLLLVQSRTLIVRMIAIAGLTKDYQAVSEIIGYKPLNDKEYQAITTLLTPVTAAEKDMTLVLQGEAQFQANIIKSLKPSLLSPKSWEGLLVKKQATLNLVIPAMIDFSKLSRLPSENLPTELSAFNKRIAQQMKPFHADSLYNPVGRILAAIAIPSFDGYAFKVHNLEAKRRMVLIHLMAKKKGVKSEGMEAFLKPLGKDLTNPYTNEPMKWDSKKNTIYMDSPEASKKDAPRIELQI